MPYQYLHGEHQIFTQWRFEPTGQESDDLTLTHWLANFGAKTTSKTINYLNVFKDFS